MPKLPMIGTPRENMNVPSQPQYDVGSAGAVDRAWAQTAGKVAELGMSLLEKRKKAADNDFAFKTYVDDYQAVEKYSQKLKIEMPEDATGYHENMTKFIADRRSENEKQAPSDDGLRLYREKSTTFFKGAEIEAQNYENTTKAKYYVKSLDENANKLAATLLSNPDYTKAKDMQLTLETELEQNAQTHFVDAGTREKLKQQMRNHVSMSVYDGLAAQERYGEQIRLLKNTDPKTDIFAGMDGEKRGNLLRHAAAAMDTKERQGNAELRGQIADVMDRQLHGEEVSNSVLTALSQKIQISRLRPDEKEKYGDSLQVSAIVATEKKRLLQTPMSLWGDPVDAIPMRPDAKNNRVVSKAQNALASEMMQMKKEAMTDPASYALKSSPALMKQSSAIRPGDSTDTQDFDSQLLARQEALGISKPRILTLNQSQQLGQNFINQTPDEAARSALALKAAHGKQASKIFAEIAKDGKLPADFMMMAYVQTPQAATSVMDNLKRQPDINKAFEEKYKFSEKDFERRVSTKMDAYASALASQGTGALSLSNALQSQVAIEAKKRMVLGADSKMDTAIENAMDSVIKPNFVPVHPTGSRSNFLMPRFAGNGRPLSEESVSAFITAYSSRDGFKALNIAVPPNVQGFIDAKPKQDDLGKFMAPSETGQDRFYKMLEQEAYWTPSSDNSELILAMKVNGQAIAMKNTDGNSIRRSFHDITFDPDERTSLAALPAWKRMFKSNAAKAGSK